MTDLGGRTVLEKWVLSLVDQSALGGWAVPLVTFAFTVFFALGDPARIDFSFVFGLTCVVSVLAELERAGVRRLLDRKNVEIVKLRAELISIQQAGGSQIDEGM